MQPEANTKKEGLNSNDIVDKTQSPSLRQSFQQFPTPIFVDDNLWKPLAAFVIQSLTLASLVAEINACV